MHIDRKTCGSVDTRTAVDNRRILRLAFGIALAIAVSEAVNWPIAFVTPILVGFLLSVPMPAPSFKIAVTFVGCLAGALICSIALLPYLYFARLAAVLLICLALFGSFLITAAGGSALIGTFLVLTLTLLTTIGSVNIDIFINLSKGLIWSMSLGIVFVWLAHAFLPDLPPPPTPVSGPEKPTPIAPIAPERNEAIRSAIRSVIIVLPVMLLFLFINTSGVYTVIMIKVATMGQQATSRKSRDLAQELLASTFWGGVGAIATWLAIKVFPSLVLYTLAVALAALLYGRGMFRNGGMHPKATMWQYALITMITLLGPTVGSMASGQSASDKFWLRLVYFVVIAVYGWLAVTVFDAFWKNRTAGSVCTNREPTPSGR